ncbi:adenylyl cyclase X E-like [Aphomia sociella]
MWDEDSLTRVDGIVPQQVSGLELLTRYSMNTGRAIDEFRLQEKEQTDGKQWTWKYLRDQFYRRELEELYRKYDDKLRESLIYIYIILLVIFSTIHIVLIVVGTYADEAQSQSMYLSIAMYVLRITLPILSLWKCFFHPLRKKWFWMPVIMTFTITINLLITDVAIPICSASEVITLRPAYSTIVLLSIYIFLPLRNNFPVITLGVLVSVVYVLINTFFTYYEDPLIGVMIASDVVYMIGVNLMGIYFRLMNEVVTRRSFLDRHACIESTLRLKFVKYLEERLMSSILPEHIVSRVRHDIRLIYLRLQSHNLVQNVKSFHERYVEEHDNVSILYADVVNYTKISTTLSPMKMVELLNELFGRFDDASEEHDVLRIKFLGDCYYCVSGIPKPTVYHAKNCVDLGLEMINIIKDVRKKHALNIDMRIGVHSGRILSGLIGIRKWQFDIWSKDATIASKMESTGQAGKVHITKQTLELLQDSTREYIIEPNFTSQNDLFVSKNKLETYLITKPVQPIKYKSFCRASVGLNKILTKSTSRLLNSRSSIGRRTTPLAEEHLVEYQQMRKAADAQMAKEIDDMTNGGKDQFKKEWRLNRFTLMFKDSELEKAFRLHPDPLFKYYITCCLIILVLIFLINGLTTNRIIDFQWYTWTLFGLLLFILIAMQPLTWFHFLWSTYKGIEEPKNTFLHSVYDLSDNIIKSVGIRTVMYVIISIGLAASTIVNVIGCSDIVVEPTPEAVLSNCVSSWHVTQCWILALLLNFLFNRVFFIFKWIVASGMTMFYLWMVWEIKSSLFAADATWNVGLDSRVSHTLSVVFITVTLYWIDRTTEFRNRLDYLWQVQLSEEQHEAETMLKVNNMLLENILPGHVVQVYLNLNRSIDELYYEKYDNVAVMFASLTDYKLGVEDDAELSDATVLSMLDSVISDFDRLLLTGSSVYKVEKIKMAGWTYMAACGLDPSKRTSLNSMTTSNSIVQNLIYNRALVLTMVEFAAAMMRKLQEFNRGSFQSFEGLSLRIGISNGEVAAGVVGSSKPFYDIWGHAVNMASRMDSTGETGKIQVTENTALILEECGIYTMYRGETFVKGAGYIKTYYVPLNENLDLVRLDQFNTYYNTDIRNQYDIRDNMNGYTSSECETSDTQSQFGTANLDNESRNDDTSYVNTIECNKEDGDHYYDKDSKNVSLDINIASKVELLDDDNTKVSNSLGSIKNNVKSNNENYDLTTVMSTEVNLTSHTDNVASTHNRIFTHSQNVDSSMIEETEL